MAKLALLGGEPQVGDLFPQWPQSTELEARLLMETLDSGNWWRMSGTAGQKIRNGLWQTSQQSIWSGSYEWYSCIGTRSSYARYWAGR